MIAAVSDTPYILVLGGGPAGGAASRTLATLGHRVRLITRSAALDGPRLAVSIPPSGGKLFDVLGVRAAVDAAGCVRTSGNTVWWGEDRVRLASFPDGDRGWQVEVGSLAQVLLAAAAEAGVAIEQRSVRGDEPEARLAPLEPRPPAFLLDCTGRAGVRARAVAVRVPEPDLRSVALVGVWRRPDPWPVPDDTHTLIESYADGWAWSIPIAPGVRHIAVMVDPRTSTLARGLAVEVYRTELAKTRRFSALLAGAALSEGPWGWDASMYASDRYVHDNTLLVGDAGSFVDPLSSAGVRKALVSGWTAALAVHTSLTDPGRRAAALQFYEAREHRMYADLRRLARSHLAEAASGHDAPFWDDRRFVAEVRQDDLAGSAVPEVNTAVREAFERVRQAPSLRLARGFLNVASLPAIRGHEIVLEPRIVTPGAPEGVRFVAGVDVLRLVELAPLHAQVPDLFEAYCRDVGTVGLDTFLLVLATGVARGWLVMRKE